MKSLDGCSRKSQRIEAYLSLCYEDEIKPAIAATQNVPREEALTATSSDGSKKKLSSKLAAIMTNTREMFQNETDEMKAKVKECWNEMVAEKALSDGTSGSSQSVQ